MSDLHSLLTWVRSAAGKVRYQAIRLGGRRPRILVRLDWNLGDEIMALPLFAALKRKYRGASLVVRSRFPDLFLYHPDVDEISRADANHFDLVLDIRGENRALPRLEYWEGLLGIRLEDRQPRLFFSQDERQAIADAKSRIAPHLQIALSTGAGWRTKRWGTDNFRAMAREISNRLPGTRFLEMGKDCTWLGVGENLTNRTGIRQAAAILASCDLFIGNDSGLMHLAAAAGIPALGLFGPVDPAVLIKDNALIHTIQAAVECRGCWSAGRMLSPDRCPIGEPICMASITPYEVCARAVEILRRGKISLHATICSAPP